jgi:biopolymer transport protein ExbB/TolQ
MSTQDKNTSTQLDRLEQKLINELTTIKREVDDLYETVYKGNGSPSLVTRVNSVEGKLRGLREQMDEKIAHLSKENSLKFDSLHQKLESKFGRLEGWIETRLSSLEQIMRADVESRKIDQAGGWQLKVALIAAASAVVVAIVTYFGNFGK